MGTKDKVTLALEPRTLHKKKVRALRRQGIIPGVIYGKDFEPVQVQVAGKDFEKVYKETHGTSIIDAGLGGKTISILVQEIQRDNLSHNILHIDFLKVDLKRDVTVEIPLVFVGESIVETEGRGKIGHEATSINIKCSPKNIPSEIEVDITVIKEKHDVIHASDLMLPEGASLAHGVSEDKVIATMVPTKFVEAEEEVLEGEEGEAAAAEAPAESAEGTEE